MASGSKTPSSGVPTLRRSLRSRGSKGLQDSNTPLPTDSNLLPMPNSVTPRNAGKGKGKRKEAVVVSVPSQDPSGYTSLSPSPENDSMEQSTNGYSTPATTAANTPNDSDLPNSRRPQLVNAAERARQLKNSTLALGPRKRPAQSPAIPNTADDERLAHALQTAEYADPSSKKRKIEPAPQQEVIEDSDSDEILTDEMLTDDFLSDIPHDFFGSGSTKKKLDNDDALSSDLDSGLSDFIDDNGLTDSDDDDNNNNPATTPFPFNNPPSSERSLNPSSRYRRRRGEPFMTRSERERKKLEDRHPIIIKMWDELKEMPVIEAAPAPQPPGITRKLKPFQLEGLNWMQKQEQTKWKGGLLGDEMGMGKTIQAVSLLMSDYPAGAPSLVVVPPVALMQWQSEIKSYTDGKLKVFVHHNSNAKVKHLTIKELKSYDVIMISYSGLESMHRKEVKGWKRNHGMVKEDSVIHSIKFHRLILDEAHNIKQRTTSVARACFALKSKYKWCLSGTPVQNRIGEFFSLLRFLEIQPFACYFCKSCDCQALHWTQDAQKRCTLCKHSGFSHVSVFNQEILNPIVDGVRDSEKRKAAFAKLRLVTDRIMLRRVKKDHTSSMELPPKRIQIHNEFFGEIEKDFSSSIMSNTTRQFDTYVSRGVMLNNYANIFGLIMQMRQVANHPDLILKRKAEGGQNVLVCCICDEPAEEAIRSRCRHEFCRQCAKEYIAAVEGTTPDCPRCHLPLSIDFEQPDIEQEEGEVKKNSIINRIKMENWTSSTKIEMLVYDLYKLRSQKQTHKSIVFSQFTSMLQLVEWRLHRAGISTVMLDGSMTPVQRQRSIEYFMNNVDTEVFLVSLKAGGVALNLTEASRVFIIDPWWNPAAEWQSADRCHRIGQRRPCVITRLCIEDSVESRMVLLQEKKANMINGTINKDQSEALEKLTPEDMQFLFRGN
ncbi:DNA repair protein rad16 [Myotisia sp. PD_48]|nr:DNA repair protein rad16 [Myotisia sp. PD_48]